MFKELFEIQSNVDGIIKKKVGISTFNENVNMRKLAFKVELGELANEIASFKYWKTLKIKDDYRIKDEWSDCLAFLISIYQSEKTELPKIDMEYMKTVVYDDLDIAINDKLDHLFKIEMSSYNGKLEHAFYLLYEIGVMCGYTIEELNEAYINKSKENIYRARNGY